MTLIIDEQHYIHAATIGVAALAGNDNLERFGNQIKSWVDSIDPLLNSLEAKRTTPDRPALTLLTRPTLEQKANGLDVFEFTFKVQPKDNISVSGTQNIAVFKAPGSRPMYQNLGPGETLVMWEGIMLGPSAWDDVIKLKQVQETGVSITMMFGPMMKIGIIKKFSYNINKFNLIQYAISLAVEEDSDSQTYYKKFNPLLNKDLLSSFPWLERYQNILEYCNNVSTTISENAFKASYKIEKLNNLIDMQTYNWGSLGNTPVSELYNLRREIDSLRTSLVGGRLGIYSSYMNTNYSAMLGRNDTRAPGRQR